MQKVLRPYVTSSIALVGASLIVVTPMTPVPVAAPTARAVQLAATSWGDLFNDTLTNINSIASNADWAGISQLVGDFFTNPGAVLGAITNLTPDITTGGVSLPLSISMGFPPGLALGVSGLGAMVATDNAINQAAADIQSGGFGALFNDLPGILNTALNGTGSLSLLNGIVNVPMLNGVLAPMQTGGGIDLDLTKLLDVLGVGNTSVADLLNKLGLGSLGDLLKQLTSLNLNLGDLFHDLGLDDKGLGDLLGNPTLSGLLGDLGLNGLGLGNFKLTDLLGDLGLNSQTFNLNLGDILTNLGFNSDTLNVSLSSVLSNLGLNSNTFDLNLLTVLNDLFPGTNAAASGLQTLVDDILNNLGLSSLNLGDLLNSTGLLGGVLTTLQALPIIGPILGSLTTGNLQDGLNSVSLITLVNDLFSGSTTSMGLGTILQDLGLGSTTSSSLTVGSLLNELVPHDVPLSGTTTIGGLLSDLLGGNFPVTGNMTIGDILNDLLGAAHLPALNDLTLGGLLGDLGGGSLNVGSLLNNLNLGDLLTNLGLDKLPVDLGDLLKGIDLNSLLDNLGNLNNLTLDGLLNTLGVGDLANISVGDFGGFYTELFDTIPQQLLADLG